MLLKPSLFKKNCNSCIKCVGGFPICNCCGGKLIKHGFSASGKWRFKCKTCFRTRVDMYSYLAYQPNLNKQIIALTKEGLGIRSTSRILGISTTTLIKRIKHIAANIIQPKISMAKTYEVDEIRTFIKRKDKLIWIVCALERSSKKVVSFTIGPRTCRTLNVVLNTLINAKAEHIYTDGLRYYRFLIDKNIHKVRRYATNHIERNNLTIRTHLKRLNRKTICFSRSVVMLRACLKIYFFN